MLSGILVAVADGQRAEIGFHAAPSLLPGLVASTVGYSDHGAPPGLHRGLPSPYLTFIFSFADPIVTGSR